MDITLKKKALQNLARTEGEIAERAVRNEVDKIISVFQTETDYNLISEQLELLDSIAYRVSEESIGTIKRLIDRLENLELTYGEVVGSSIGEVRKYQNNSTLIVKALELLTHIRYHQPSDYLDVFFERSCSADESVAKQAIQGIEKFAAYDLDIFYGDGEDWKGLGWGPQDNLLEKIASFDEDLKRKYLNSIIVACEKMLSPTMSGTRSTYKTFTWSTAAIPAIDGVKKVRRQALKELQNLYILASDTGQKKSVLNALETASNTPHQGEYGDDVSAMIIEDTNTVLQFMKSIVVFDDMLFMQKIEHDAYWLLYRLGERDASIQKTALEIRDRLYANQEYQMFRTLIGFESIFHEWERGKGADDYDREREFREFEALKLAEAIDANSYEDWKRRIISYAQIRSDDLATFPYFGNFLEHFGKTSPELALRLLTEVSDQLGHFIIALLCGISKTDHKEEGYSLIERWCNEDKYLFSLVRFFEFAPEINESILGKLLDKAVAQEDINSLNQVISSISAHYTEDTKGIFDRFFMPALDVLSGLKSPNWIFSFWYRNQSKKILSDMGSTEHEAILDNLIWLQKIDYHAEEILGVIAENSPMLVIQYFCDRLLKKDNDDGEREYEAIPFQFHKISKPLSRHPVQIVDALYDIYDGNYGLFIFRGARFIKNIFPNYPLDFQEKLLDVIQSKEEKDLLFVMAILKNYDGNPAIYNTCKELVKIMPDGSRLSNELHVILESTGVVSGEYGFVEAYKQKINKIQPWLEDRHAKVKEFAQSYIAGLEKRIDYEQKRADESIILRKHEYGIDDE